jgi:signal transduction histidine kinase
MAEILNNWFNDYQPLVFYLYGLVFYTLGLTIMLQARQKSRLILAKSLPWLGAFGMIHGFFEWGDVFIPLQVQKLGSQYFTVFVLVQLIILAFSYFALFQFGIELLRPFNPRLSWVRFIPLGMFLLWLTGPFIIGFSFINDFTEWSTFSNVMARYLLCVPGSIFSVIGLIHQQRLQIKPLKLPQIDNVVRIGAGTLATYGVLSGLIVPKSFIFPSTVLNYENFTRVMLMPPAVYRSIIGIVLLIAIIRSLDIFDLETNAMIQKMEEAQVVANEKEHMARDLHDGALQQVYAAGLLAESLKKHVPSDQATEVDHLIGTINEAINQLRDFLPQQRLDVKKVDLAEALMPKIEEARRHIRIDTLWQRHKLPSLSIEQTRHVAALMSEAISNVIRHAKSDHIEISLNYQENRLVMEIRDFGEGIPTFAEQGYGLKNMRDRAKLLGATLNIRTEIEKGTTVIMDMPLEESTDED